MKRNFRVCLGLLFDLFCVNLIYECVSDVVNNLFKRVEVLMEIVVEIFLFFVMEIINWFIWC